MTTLTAPSRSTPIARYIIIGLIAGIALGFLLNERYLAAENEKLAMLDVSIGQVEAQALQATDDAWIAELEATRETLAEERSAVLAAREKKVEPFSLMAHIFLRLIKMIVAPLVFSTLVVGVARLGDIKSVGRIGGRTLLWFIGASLTSLLLGMMLVNVLQPGLAMQLPLPDASEQTGIVSAGL